MGLFAKMNIYSVATLAIVLFMTVAVLGAPSNSTSTHTAGHKKPVTSTVGSGHAGSARSGNSSSHSSFFIKGAATSTKAPTGVVSASKKSNSTRVTRDIEAEDSDEVQEGISEGRSEILKSTSNISNKKSNSTRTTRNAGDDEAQADDHKSTSNSSSSAQHFVPSTHPLFANRQSSNITNNLKPKLRTPGAVHAAGGSSDSSDEEKSSGAHVPSSPNGQKVHSTESSEETVSVVSSGHVSVKSKDSSRPVGIGSRRASTSTTHSPIEDDEVAVFVF